MQSMTAPVRHELTISAAYHGRKPAMVMVALRATLALLSGSSTGVGLFPERLSKPVAYV
jgi:hypothetical protein